MTYLSNITRPVGDPKVLQSGRSSLGASDQLSRALGWFSIALGVTQLMAPRRITEALGMQGNEGLVRAYGAREIGSGLLSLSIEKDLGLWSRVAGDALDIATVATAMRPGNRKIGNVILTLALLAGITAIDVLGAQAVTVRHKRTGGTRTQYSDHGPWTIIEAGAARGRQIASWPSLQTDLRNAGAEWMDREAVVDGNLVSSRKPDDIPAFNREMIRLFSHASRQEEPRRAS